MRNDPTALNPSSTARGNGETILVIEDEPGVREMVRRLLEFRGFRTLVAESGPAGLALYRLHQAAVRAIITDMRMPVMQGAQVIQELRAINPDVRIVAMSGVIDSNGRMAEETARLAFLPKPMTSSELVDALQRVLVAPAA